MLRGRPVLCPRELGPGYVGSRVCVNDATTLLSWRGGGAVLRVVGGFEECTYLKVSGLLYSLHQAPPLLKKAAVPSTCISERYISTLALYYIVVALFDLMSN